MTWIRRYQWPILSGFLIGTSYIPFPPWALLFGQVPLWLFWLDTLENRESFTKKQLLWRVFVGGWITQYILTLIGFHWVAHTIHEFGRMPQWLSVLGLLAFCTFAHLHIPLAGVIWAWLAQRFQFSKCISLPLSLTTLVALISLSEMYFPMIFSWNHGYTWFWTSWQGYQWADVIGFQGLSSISLLFNAGFLILWRHRKDLLWVGAGLLTMVGIFLLLHVSGELRRKNWEETDSLANVHMIQANIGNLQKQMAERGYRYRGHILSRYGNLTHQSLQQNGPADFIVWPETAFPAELDPPFQRSLLVNRVQNMIKAAQTTLITGSYSKKKIGGKVHNGIFIIDPLGKIRPEAYRKTHLLAFGEYFPGGETFPKLKTLVPAISDFGRGNGPEAFTVTKKDGQPVKIGMQICYEGLYPYFSRELAKQGSDIFLNVTNDSWFGRKFEPFQHLYMTLARTIENRRPLVRSTNTGITTAVLADGTVLQQSPLHVEWTGSFAIKYKTSAPLTFFTLYGQYLPLIYALMIFITCLVALVRLKQAHDKA